MDIMELESAKVTQDKLAKELSDAVAFYRDTMRNENSTRDEIRTAANTALRKAFALLDAKNETIEALIMAGKALAEAAIGSEPRPLS